MFAGLSAGQRSVLLNVLNGVLVGSTLAGLGLFVLVLGWPLGEVAQEWVRLGTRAVLGLFVTQTFVRVLLDKHPLRVLGSRKLEVLLAVLIFCETFFGRHFHSWLRGVYPEIAPGTLALFLLGCTQLTFLVVIGVGLLRRNPLLASSRLTPGGVFIGSFAVVILAGTLLLMTPRATPDGIGWVDALFTATSAVCVNGLGTVDIATGFTRQGHWIILGLMQVGGLGMMTLTYFFAHFLAGGVSLRNRMALQNLLSEDNLGQIGTVLGVIVGFTLACEAAGALAIHFCLQQAAIPPEDPIFFSIFHSVSAFCNAGMSTLPDNLADPAMRGLDGMLVVLMLLIIVGGIGFPVIKNLWEIGVAVLRKRIGLRLAVPPRLTTNSRVVLVTSVVLLAGGAVVIYLTEFVLGSGSSGETCPWLAAIFHSVAARSSGFNVTNTALLAPGTLVVVMGLMFIGGSPSSTAGGIKTSTVAVAFLSLRRVVLGLPEIEAFGRRISDDTANRALAIVLLAGAFFLLVATTLCALHPHLPPLDMIFETMSAASSAGLGRGVSAQLSVPGKMIMAGAMFVGRIGVLMFLLAFIPKQAHTGYKFPEATIVIA